MTTLDWLPDDEARAAGEVLDAITRGAGEKLVSVVAVGAYVPPRWPTVADRVELLVVLSEAPMFVLGNLAHQVRQRDESARVSVLVMTERELLRATDVFTLELADYGSRHRVLTGRDVLRDLHFTPGELRLAIERRLRFLSRDVRQTMLTGAWHDGRPAKVRAVLRRALGDLLVVSHNLAVLAGGLVSMQTDARGVRVWRTGWQRETHAFAVVGYTFCDVSGRRRFFFLPRPRPRQEEEAAAVAARRRSGGGGGGGGGGARRGNRRGPLLSAG